MKVYRVATYYTVTDASGVVYEGHMETNVYAYDEAEAVRWHETYVTGQVSAAFKEAHSVSFPLSYAYRVRKDRRQSVPSAW